MFRLERLMLKTSEELRAFVFGTIFGIVALVGCFTVICWTNGIKFQPVIEQR